MTELNKKSSRHRNHGNRHANNSDLLHSQDYLQSVTSQFNRGLTPVMTIELDESNQVLIAKNPDYHDQSLVSSLEATAQQLQQAVYDSGPRGEMR